MFDSINDETARSMMAAGMMAHSSPHTSSSGAVDLGNLNASRRKKTPRSGVVWTAPLDQLLREAVQVGGFNWEDVGLRVQQRLTAASPMHPTRLPTVEDCEKRWRQLNPESKTYPPWSDEEKLILTRLVEEAQFGDSTVFSKSILQGKSGQRMRTISWVQIAERLNRAVLDVSHMWSQIRVARFKRGSFTEEEDRLIIQRVQEWNNMPSEQRPRHGLWVAIEREIGREDKRVSERYRNILFKKVNPAPPPAPVMTQEQQNQLALQQQQMAALQQQQLAQAQHQAHLQQQHMQQQQHLQQVLQHQQHAMGHHLPAQQLQAQHIQQLQATQLIMSYPALGVVPPNTLMMTDRRVTQPSDEHLLLISRMEHESGRKRGLDDTHPQLLDHPVPASSQVLLANANIPASPQEKRKRIVNPESVRWNTVMDSRLLEGMNLFGNDWDQIATFVNGAPRGDTGRGIVDQSKCRGRWYRVLRKKDANEAQQTIMDILPTPQAGMMQMMQPMPQHQLTMVGMDGSSSSHGQPQHMLYHPIDMSQQQGQQHQPMHMAQQMQQQIQQYQMHHQQQHQQMQMAQGQGQAQGQYQMSSAQAQAQGQPTMQHHLSQQMHAQQQQQQQHMMQQQMVPPSQHMQQQQQQQSMYTMQQMQQMQLAQQQMQHHQQPIQQQLQQMHHTQG